MPANDLPVAQNSNSLVWPRRTWLKAAAGAVVASRACGALAAERPKTARKLRLGIHTAPYAGFPLEDAVARLKDDGFSSVLTDYVFADVRFDPLAPDWEAAGKIVQCFERRGVRIAAVFGYYNVVDPDAARRQRGEARMSALVANWKRLGCPVISTETGTLNATSEWLESPDNATEKGYQTCKAAFEKMARAAEKTGAIISVEPYWRNIIDSIERTERLLREIQSPALKLVMDPCNYFRKEQLPQMRPMLEAMFKRLGSQIVVAHAKDVKAAADGTDLPAAGLGVLDYPLYLRLLAQQDRELDLLLEHLTLADVPRARDFVKGHLDKMYSSRGA